MIVITNTKRPTNTVVFVAVVLFMVIISGCLVFIFHFQDTNYDAMFRYVYGATDQRQVPVNQHMTSSLQILNGAASEEGNIPKGIIVLVVIACVFLLALLIWQIISANKNKKKLEDLAYIDQLTGLRNYTKFLIDADELLRENRDSKRKFALWDMDIKSFNEINEIFGSDKGDEFLCYMGSVFLQCSGQKSFTARISADNFVGIIEYEQKEDLIKLFEELKETVRSRTLLPESEKRIDFSIGGLCLDDLSPGLSVREMINSATIAKKHAKNLSGTQLVFFDSKMGERQKWIATLELSAKHSMENGEIKFVLQPKVNIQGSKYRVESVEALVRWDYPNYGIISPGDFVPLFEENGVIVEMDRYIFKETCKWYVSFVKRYNMPLKISVNVSRQGIIRDDMVEYYSSVKDEFGIADGIIELEFTESMVADEFEYFKNTIIALKEKGFVTALDDFGSGYSSLNALKSLPIDVLKLDALFFKEVENLDKAKIVISNFISMAKELGIQTVSEGIETKATVEYLKTIGGDLVQGYVFSKPLMPDEFEKYISSNKGIVSLR